MEKSATRSGQAGKAVAIAAAAALAMGTLMPAAMAGPAFAHEGASLAAQAALSAENLDNDINAARVVLSKVPVYTGSPVHPNYRLTMNGKVLVEGVDYVMELEDNVDAGYGSVTFKGIGEYTGEVYGYEFRISPANITSAAISAIPDQAFNGAFVKPVPAITFNGKALVEGVDFALGYMGNESVGTATVEVYGKGNFTGTKTLSFEVSAAQLSGAKVEKIPTQAYSGKAVEPEPTVTFNGNLLDPRRDYTLSYKNNKEAGTATVVLKGKGNYTGKKEATFKIARLTIADANISLSWHHAYTGDAVKPKPTVTYGGKTLKEGRDYTLSYSNNVKTGEHAKVKVVGKGNFSGSKVLEFSIEDADISSATLKGLDDVTYTGEAMRQEPKVTWKGEVLVKGRDYTLSYKNATEAGTATVKVTGKGNYKGSKSATYKILRASIEKAEVAKIANLKHTGQAVEPKPKVTWKGKTLKKDRDYTLSYKNNKKAGTATVTVTGRDNFKGKVTATFKIVKK